MFTNEVCSTNFILGTTILHRAIDSKNFETIAVIIKQINMAKDEMIKETEMNKEVGIHKWTPLYRAGLFIYQ